ncbi:zinc transporter ZIP12-like [Nematolebias whitei]|uniref:zinc transporter ZIP12-like n=1 Tax=Nematolebias whitei TaxID=451745 RepID=UPI00189BD09C|nr:zinc transporter ZIP12-like [Nematolebias whitei]
MHFRSTAPCLVLLLHLFVLERVLESNAQDQDYLQEALRTLNLTLGSDDKFRLQKNRTSDLITKLLRDVHCAERTGMTQKMCEKCLTPSIVLSVLEDGDSIYLNEADYQRISTVLLYYIINLEHQCVSNDTSLSLSYGSLEFYLLALTNLEPAEDNHFLSHSEIQSILQLINQHYHPSKQDVLDLPCIDSARLLEDVDAEGNPGVRVTLVPKVAAIIISYILRGYCFTQRNLPSPTFFTDYIFQSLNSTNNLQIIDLEKLLRQLGVGAKHHRKRRSNKGSTQDLSMKSLENSGHKTEKGWEQVCFSAKQLVDIFDLDPHLPISKMHFRQICPAIIQQLLCNACGSVEQKTGGSPPTAIEKYGYSTTAVLVITVSSMLGICLVFFNSCQETYTLILQLFVGLAVGTLSGDALLHLIPQILGLHDGTHSHDEELYNEDKAYLWKILCLIAGIYGFFLIEKVFSYLVPSHAHGHSNDLPLELTCNGQSQRGKSISTIQLVSLI